MKNQEKVYLTETVKKGGCAAKLPASTLKAVLGDLRLKSPKELSVGVDLLDDACVWDDLSSDNKLIQSLDFFTPIVDDPYDFGAIAAANALSDIYAMGGDPITALSILAFPMSTLDDALIYPLMKGAVDKIEESGACLGGGHSIDDDTLKLGFSVSGFVQKDRCWTNSGAKVGDYIILTKGLGTGTITSALKGKKAEDQWVKSAIESMTLLNNVPEMVREFDIHAATDVTGFSLCGHGMQVANASGVSFDITMDVVPLIDGAVQAIKDGWLNKAHKTNEKYVEGHITWSENVSPEQRWLTLDAQTSGGLLLFVSANDSENIINKIKSRFPMTSLIGKVSEAKAGEPVVRFNK